MMLNSTIIQPFSPPAPPTRRSRSTEPASSLTSCCVKLQSMNSFDENFFFSTCLFNLPITLFFPLFYSPPISIHFLVFFKRNDQQFLFLYPLGTMVPSGRSPGPTPPSATSWPPAPTIPQWRSSPLMRPMEHTQPYTPTAAPRVPVWLPVALGPPSQLYCLGSQRIRSLLGLCLLRWQCDLHH